MNIFFSKTVTESMRSVDAELDRYFSTTTRVRSRARTGTVVIVDPSDGLYNFLNGIVGECNLKFCLYHVRDAQTAKKALAELGQENVKVVVINCDLLFASANGVTLAQWIEEYFPNIPIWVSECSEEKSIAIRKLSRRVGTVPKGEPLQNIAEALGFPSKCFSGSHCRRRQPVFM